MRSGEAKSLEWRDVDRENSVIRHRRENSKNGKPRLLPLLGALSDIIDERDLCESMAKAQEHLARQQEAAKVVSIKAAR